MKFVLRMIYFQLLQTFMPQNLKAAGYHTAMFGCGLIAQNRLMFF